MRENQHPDYTYNYNKGIMYLNSGNYEEALTAFEKARSCWDNSYAYSGMGRAYYGLHEYLLALTNFEIAYQKYSGNLQAAHWRAKTLARLQRYKESEELFKNVLNCLSGGPIPFYQEVMADYEEMMDQRDGGNPEISDGRNLSFMQNKPGQQPAPRYFIHDNQGPVNIGGIQATDDAVVNRAHVDKDGLQATGDSVVNRSPIESTKESINKEEATKESPESSDKHTNLANEYVNPQNRSKHNVEAAAESATKKLALDMLEVVDNFERAIKNEDKKHIEGLVQVHKFFLSALSRNGIEKMQEDGKKFDPNFHEAIATVPSDKPEGTIVNVTVPGYTLHNKILRHAKVAVAAKPNDSPVSSAISNKSRPKFCPQCGTSLDADDNFCPECGRKL